MTKKKVKNYCGKCGQDTWHDVEGGHMYVHDPSEYHIEIGHFVVKCRGCERVSFRKVTYDYEAAYPTVHDQWEVPTDIEIFPRQEKGNIDSSQLPKVVKSIYDEACGAYRDNALTLAGIGFRATIEAICNDQDIKGKELNTRINNLASRGLISKKDSTRLHSIRFLGNDAAHDIKIPSIENLDAAMIIVEHLITTVYVLDKESKGKLEEVILEYEKFEELLAIKLKEYSSGDEYPLQKFLGKDVRLLSGSIKSTEKQLNERIGRGDFKILGFGERKKYLDSKEELQHYVVS